VPYEGVAEPFIDLLQGRTDAVLLDDVIVARYGQNPDLRVVSEEAFGSYAIGVRRDEPDLRAALDDALSHMTTRGELRAILERWKLNGSRGVPSSDRTNDEVAPDGLPSHAGFELSPHQLALFAQGAGVTIVISTAAMVLAITLGMLLALARLPSPLPARRALARAATAYVEIFRGTPVLLQLYVLYYGLSSITPLGPFTAAILGLGLNYAAYEAELYRAGFEAVPVGQTEAALALGMSRWLALRRIVLPQALRVALPGVANDFIALLKDSSLVSVITVVELTKQMTITAVDVRGWLGPGLLCAGLYLALSYPLSRLARRLERRLAPASA
jgi:polar amino acid transport system substrate-binding protein